MSAASSGAATARPLAADDRAAIARLRELLDRVGYTGDGIRAALGTEDTIMSRPEDIPVHDRRLAPDEPLATLIRLFVLDLDVRERAARALEPDELARLGLVELRGDRVAPLVRIVPHDETIVVSDRRLAKNAPAAADHVAGVQAPSVTLAHLTIRRPVASTLDLGTGSGIQALRSARHSGRVVATDVNARALNFAAFNAALNGVDNVELRRGGGFDPVAGERFDLVVSNPPYVISPESRWVFRDSGLEGDSFSEQLVRRLPEHLEEGGFATILVSWILRGDEEWSEPLRRWVDGGGCDALLLHYRTEDPLAAAAAWNRDVQSADPAGYGEAIDGWLTYFRELRVDAIGYGAIVLRRRSGARNWVRADPLPPGRLAPASDHLLRLFAAQDALEAGSLLDGTFALAARARLEETRTLTRDGVESGGITLLLEEGLGFRGGVDETTADLLLRLDGTRPLREHLGEAARAQDADADAFAQAALPVVEQLLRLGFLDTRLNG